MKKLTKRERKVVIRAAELIESERERFSCFAILFANFRSSGVQNDILLKYANFYDKSTNSSWFPRQHRYKEERILLLLTFAELG